MKRTFAAVLTLIILAATAMSLPACMNSYEHAGEIGGLEIYISKRYNRGFAGAYFWDGSAESMTIDVPDEYDGCPITALGGVYGTGVPVTFGVIYPDRQYAEGENVYSVSPAAAEASIERLKNEGGLEIEYLDFTVNLGSNVEDFDMIDSPLTVIEREGDNMNSAYVVRYYFNCDGDNGTLYSDGGKLYFRSSGDLVDEFYYTDFTF